MSKEKDLCRAVAMAADQPTLLQRAIEAYKRDYGSLSIGQELLYDAEIYLDDMRKLETTYKDLLGELYDLSGLDICEIGYDD